MELTDFLHRLDKVRQTGEHQYTACCPAHSDSSPSLSIGYDGNDSKILLKCQAGCNTADILGKLGLSFRDLYANPRQSQIKKQAGTFLREHIYVSENGTEIADKKLYKDRNGKKYAVWYRITAAGEYMKGLKGLKAPLYHLDKLVNSSGTVYIAEGEKDVETLEKMGLTATTSPNGAGAKWNYEYNRYLENRDIIILADNDEAGEKHGNYTARALLSSAASVKLIKSKDVYPDIMQKGDISDIAAAVGIEKAKALLLETAERTERYINSHVAEKQSAAFDETGLPPFIYEKTSPSGTVTYAVNRPELAKFIRKEERFFFLDTNGNKPIIYWYDKTCGIYRQLSDNSFKGVIKKPVENFSELCVKSSDLDEVYKLLVTDMGLVKKASDINCNEKYICFENGLLDIDTLELIPHTPDIIYTIMIPCKWNPNANKAPIFEDFILSLSGRNKEIVSLLMEFMGLTISNIPGYRTKQALFLYGPGDTGKSKFLALLGKLIGSDNFASIDLKELEERFGTACISGKRLAGCPDMSAMKIGELKMFKKLTGGDEISIEYKGKDRFSDTYRGVLMFCSNELPKFGGDRGAHVYDRMLLVKCDNVIPADKRDGKLLDKLYSEREAIVHNVVIALKRFINNGYKFHIPNLCEILKKSYMTENDNVFQFLEECTIERVAGGTSYKDLCTTKNIYTAYSRWSQYSGLYTYDKINFQKSLCQKFGRADISELRHKYNGQYYYPFTLTNEAKCELLGWS